MALMIAVLLPLLTLASPFPVTSELMLDFGYSVSTVLDFNKLLSISTVHPFALLPLLRSDGLVLLDSSGSAFYSIATPLSQESDVSLLSGKGTAGFADGDPTVAMFHRPRSFAIDSVDNVYVADRINHAIRKIGSNGVTTTIAGGYSGKPGHVDGPAQNASFSDDFDLVYVPKLCALIISDRGNRLIRQLDLKPEDCTHKSQSGLGAAPVALIGILCMLLGSVLGCLARHFLASHGVFGNRCVNKTWSHYQGNLGRRVLITCSGIRNAVANSTLWILFTGLVDLSFCYLSVVYRNIRQGRQVQSRKPVTLTNSCIHAELNPFQSRESASLIDSDVAHIHGEARSLIFADPLEDLISFENVDTLELKECFDDKQKDQIECANEGSLSKVEQMIIANLSDFGSEAKLQGQKDVISPWSDGMVQRRPKGAGGL